MHILLSRVGPQYLTYCAINLMSDWSRVKLQGGGAVPIYESVATENASKINPENERVDAAGLSTQRWLYCRPLLRKGHHKPSRNKRYPTKTTRRQLQPSPRFSAIPPVSSAFFWASLQPFWLFWLSSKTPFFFLLDWARAMLAFLFAFSLRLESDMHQCILLLLTN